MNSKKTDCGAINPDLVEKVKPNMPKINLLFELSDFFKVMGDSTRLRLLWALEEEELCVGDLAVILEMTKSAKLVKSRKIGKNVYYSLDDHHVKTVLEKALEHVCE